MLSPVKLAILLILLIGAGILFKYTAGSPEPKPQAAPEQPPPVVQVAQMNSLPPPPDAAPAEFVPAPTRQAVAPSAINNPAAPPVFEPVNNDTTADISSQNQYQQARKPDVKLYPGAPIKLTPPPRGSNTNYNQFNRIVEHEQRYPTFEGDTLNVYDRQAASEWRTLYQRYRNASLEMKIQQVNNFFNRWEYKVDIQNWRRKEYWANPREFIEQSGDCEDYAITKYYALKALGVPVKDMRVMGVDYPTPEKNYHIVLIVMSPKNDYYLLDIGMSEIFVNGGPIAYKPMYYLNENQQWRHVATQK